MMDSVPVGAMVVIGAVAQRDRHPCRCSRQTSGNAPRWAASAVLASRARSALIKAISFSASATRLVGIVGHAQITAACRPSPSRPGRFCVSARVTRADLLQRIVVRVDNVVQEMYCAWRTVSRSRSVNSRHRPVRRFCKHFHQIDADPGCSFRRAAAAAHRRDWWIRSPPGMEPHCPGSGGPGR